VPTISKYNPERLPEIRQKLASGQSITQVARDLGVSRKTFYNWLESHNTGDFKDTVEEGLTAGEAVYEQKLLDIVDGNLKCTRAQLTSLIYLMKCRYKERWLERPDVDTAPVRDKPLAGLTDKEIDSQLKTLLELKLNRPLTTVTTEDSDRGPVLITQDAEVVRND
jgi:transposase-like protein